MKSKRTIKKKICMLAMLSFLACTLFPLNILNIPKVNADALGDLNNSLTWAKAYLDRSYTEFGTTDYNKIANPGFENWNVLGQPDNWNIRIGSNIDKESSIVHSGSSSIKLGPATVTGTVISPGTWTLTFIPSLVWSYSAWIRFEVLPTVEYRMGINTESKNGLAVYIEMGVVNGRVFMDVIENGEYILANTTFVYAETGVWTNWNITMTGCSINWFFNETFLGEYSYSNLASKPMTPDIALPGNPEETGSLYVDDTFFGLPQAMSAGMRDLPGLPFVMQDVTDDKWICPAKATQAVQDGNDGPDWGYYGGCGIDVIDYGYDSDRLKIQYRWDTECDSTFDGVVMYVELITLDNVNMKCYANITSKADSDHCALWLDNETVIDPVSVGASFDRTHAYGWFTTRFVVRHGTKIAANMYNALGETDKATKLLNLWYGSGYTKDTYDGIWAASNGYAYYEGGYPWAANPFVVMPDPDMWGDIPWFQMSQEGTEHSGIPYRSQLQNEVVRMLGFQTGPGISLGKSWWECGFTFKMAWACYLLNKYNTSDSSKLAEAKQLIDDVSWNGLGISSETLRVGPALVSLYAYACYVPYADAEYLAALTRYWELTGDEFYGERADEVAGILLKVQVKPGDKIRVADSNGDIRLIWRPDNTGGFMCGYKYGGGWDFGSSPFWLADTYFWATSVAGLYNRDYAELSSCGWTNHETTLMSYAALYQYNQTGRTPLTSSVDFTMPFFDAQASTSHSDHGCDSIQADNSGNIRTFLSESAYGESWSTVTYSWTVELPALTNFRTKLTVYIPYYGQDGNAVERWVRIYNSSGRLVVSDYDKPINGVGGYGERYIIYTNMTPLDSLIAEIYTFKLTFRFSCGWAGEFAVGYRYDYLMRPTEPMHIETFGCNFDAVPIPLTPKYYVHICSSGPGTVYPYGDFLIDEGQTVNSTATPEPGKYFWYWIINNTALGIYWNFTTNPLYLYVDHDYNVTAYFGGTYVPPPPNRTLVISNHDPALGTTSPSPGNYSYVQGSLVSVNATPNTGYIFEYWRCLDGGMYNNYSNPITVEMNQDYRLVAYFGGTTIYFPVYDSSSAELLSNIQIYYGYPSHWWIELSPLYIDAPLYVHANDCPIGTFSFKFSAIGYYDYYVWNISIPTGSTFYFPTVWMNEIGFYHPKGGGGLCYLRSSLITFYATIPYSNETQYADMDHYIKVQVLPGTSGTLKLVIHYDTDYPIVEIDAENLTLTEFDLEAIYQHYCLSSYEDMQQASLFTGLKISSNTPLQINLEMPQALDFWHRPSELLKIGEDGGISSFSSWQCSGRTVTLNFEPGDPTLSMIFHAEPDAMTLTFWNLIPFIFIVGSVVMLIPTILAAKRRNFKEFAILLVGFLIVTALIPIIPQLMA